MATHIREATRPHSAAVTQRKLNVGKKDLGHASAVMPAVAISPGRRCEVRMDYRDMCSYEVLESIGEELVVIGKGRPLHSTGAREECFSSSPWPRTRSRYSKCTPPAPNGRGPSNIFETRWTRPVQVGVIGNLYLAGCQRIFGFCTICRSSRTGQGHCRANGVGD